MFRAGSINVEVSRISLQQESQSFLVDQCDGYISNKNRGFDVRWVRFPKHIPLFFHAIPIGICGFGGFLWLGSEMTQRISRGYYCVICVETVRSPGGLGSHRD